MIDWAQVRQLQEDVGADEMDEVVELFLDEVDEVMENLATGYEAMAPNDRSAAFHLLKGCASNLGFKTFADQCSQGEDVTKAGNEPDFKVADLVQVYASSKASFMANKVSQLG
ncbi:Hpt domain-containing protein [Amylibacter sp. SFDW26]|uniref:Hpt domain-containing protein n=1 Tax=Amylibacter sp. SFDW26 TaxID=2652722 RepID=UPI001262A8C8|nr:Hpt domain-containing protein [Amylibacter sp. SFDW26]KAB7614675.1 Hpt domain-containing protein [Amylibacter sp. SFDW26]